MAQSDESGVDLTAAQVRVLRALKKPRTYDELVVAVRPTPPGVTLGLLYSLADRGLVRLSEDGAGDCYITDAGSEALRHA